MNGVVSNIHVHTRVHTYIYTYICFSLVHHTALTATGCETSHLTTYMTNIQVVFNIIQFNHNYVHKKGEAVPLPAWTGPEGSRRLRFPDFKTTGT